MRSWGTRHSRVGSRLGSRVGSRVERLPGEVPDESLERVLAAPAEEPRRCPPRTRPPQASARTSRPCSLRDEAVAGHAIVALRGVGIGGRRRRGLGQGGAAEQKRCQTGQKATGKPKQCQCVGRRRRGRPPNAQRCEMGRLSNGRGGRLSVSDGLPTARAPHLVQPVGRTQPKRTRHQAPKNV